MDKYTATEQAYKHGYEKGYEEGKKDSVVCCKDCEWFNSANCAYGFGWCVHFDIGMFETDFCSHGSRKEHDSN